jgi:hypothetical protein
MRTMRRWEKDEEYVELETGDTELQSVVVVKSSRGFDRLPIEFREVVPISDEAKIAVLVNAVEAWATKNGFRG